MRAADAVRKVVAVLGARGVLAAAACMVLLFEGVRLVSYQDTGGVWTICAGHTATAKPGQVATEAECAEKTEADLLTASRAVDRLVVAPVTPACRVALIDFAYNAGPGALRRSTLLVKINRGDQYGAADEFMRWVYVGGRDCRDPANNCRGIVTRREAEAALCRL